MSGLDQNDLVRLVRSVFPHREGDRALAILVDVPRDASRDNDAWRERRRLAAAWHAALKGGAAEIPLEEIDLIAYPDTGSNNLDRIYIPEAQPRIAVRSVELEFPGGVNELLMKDGRYLVF